MNGFTLPEYHDWPFFFTIQKNVDTRDRQMKMWTDLILSYTKSKGAYTITLNELYSSPLCINQKVNRRLSMDSLVQVCRWMRDNSKIKD
mmetsp:Transcript_19321/g.13873  ORF Transcript_19321/g.13873 Transcript_19321/m.13873 type:complete len:89 (+) Transcript_19321:34-300(+)